ncbi:YceI family protein [Aliikangiella coralliicola]|nr:YceI family protein [Aliikangiella coralliicola]
MKKLIIKGLLLVLTSVSFQVFAKQEWILNSEMSSVYFVSVKKSAVAETHTFKNISGVLTESGQAKVSIDLASVESMIPIRNERMKQHLFEVDKFPKATISAMVNADKIKRLKPGTSKQQPLKLKLSLHGIESELEGEFSVTKLANNKIQVSTLKPVIVNAATFSLVDGINKLRELASLPSISTAVPVMVTLVYDGKSIAP